MLTEKSKIRKIRGAKIFAIPGTCRGPDGRARNPRANLFKDP
jgi:hypothetical protein